MKHGLQQIIKAICKSISLACALYLLALLAFPGAAQAQSTVGPSSSNCAWPYVTTSHKLNVAYPDTNAEYWTMPYSATAGMKLIVRGGFLKARFLSVSTYEQEGSPIDSIADKDFVTIKGTNPFTPEGDPSQPSTFEVTVVPKPVSSGDTSDTALPPGSIYGVSPTGKTAAQGFLIFRIYVDGEPGGTQQSQLPEIIVDIDGHERVLMPCATTQPSQISFEANQEKSGESSENTLSRPDRKLPEALFFPPLSPVDSHFPNLFNAYLSAIVRYQPGRIVVIRGKAPTPPETSTDGYPLVGHGEQMRYWSFCNNDNVFPFPVVQCKKDTDIKVDKEGYYTLVISDPNDEPSNISKDPTVTLLEFSPDKLVQNAVLLRNMLPTPDFANTVQTADSACQGMATARSAAKCAQQQMQGYYPVAAYCDKEQFEHGGWKACLSGITTPDEEK